MGRWIVVEMVELNYVGEKVGLGGKSTNFLVHHPCGKFMIYIIEIYTFGLR